MAFAASQVGLSTRLHVTADFAADCRGTPERRGCFARPTLGYCPKPIGMLQAESSPKKERSWQEDSYNECRCQEKLISLLCSLFPSPIIYYPCSHSDMHPAPDEHISLSFFLVLATQSPFFSRLALLC